MSAVVGLGQFDANDRNSWYFGLLTREEANNILQNERDSGVFLVRESTTIRGDYVLCVKEDNKVSHYIINKIQSNGTTRYRIGDQEFPDLEDLLNFYKSHYLDTTSLIKPAPREQCIAKYDFPGKDPEDLPFKKGDILTVLSKDEEQWWTAKNSEGKQGQIPVPYVQKYDTALAERLRQEEEAARQSQALPPPYPESGNLPPAAANIQNGQRYLPAPAKVIQQRIPNAYDKTALRLEVGDIVTVTAMNINGQWDGELKGKAGHFPFTHVKFVENEADEDMLDSIP